MKNRFLIAVMVLLLVPARSDVTKNSCRERIANKIKSAPGIYFSEMVRETGINRGTLRYHLEFLKKQKIIESHKVKGKVRFFPNDSASDKKEKTLIYVLRDDINRKIIQEILKCQLTDNNSLAEKVGISVSTISWHVRHMKEIGIIVVNKEGKYNTYSVDPDYYCLITGKYADAIRI